MLNKWKAKRLSSDGFKPLIEDYYLMGRKFELRTDHCGMKYLFDQPTLNVRQARWLEFLCEFDFEIK